MVRDGRALRAVRRARHQRSPGDRRGRSRVLPEPGYSEQCSVDFDGDLKETLNKALLVVQSLAMLCICFVIKKKVALPPWLLNGHHHLLLVAFNQEHQRTKASLRYPVIPALRHPKPNIPCFISSLHLSIYVKHHCKEAVYNEIINITK